ncbi:radical SAM/SPASM domain-containing protein [Lentzea sp. CA-135723]|uniref:radical SAM/SPASM domain-containing protein n=1 Tax=Lentzea sp. CA-135723 TaxID=3239950 RepID=UPI003D916F22
MTTTAPPRLNFLWLNITNNCQLACTHCYADSGPTGTHGTMSVDDWITVLDQAAEIGVTAVQLIGGEPTLYPQMNSIALHALSLGMTVEVYSNLVHVTEEMWALFTTPGVTLATSYYSDDAAEHDVITQRPSHARTRANIAKARQLGIELRAGVVQVLDQQRVEQARTDLVDLGVPGTGFDRMREVGRGAQNADTTAEELCGACGDGRVAINPDGEATVCVFAGFTQPLGNVRTTPLYDLAASLPQARDTLVSQGMPDRRAMGTSCNPDSGGGTCYPQNCMPA